MFLVETFHAWAVVGVFFEDWGVVVDSVGIEVDEQGKDTGVRDNFVERVAVRRVVLSGFAVVEAADGRQMSRESFHNGVDMGVEVSGESEVTNVPSLFAVVGRIKL